MRVTGFRDGKGEFLGFGLGFWDGANGGGRGWSLMNFFGLRCRVEE